MTIRDLQFANRESRISSSNVTSRNLTPGDFLFGHRVLNMLLFLFLVFSLIACKDGASGRIKQKGFVVEAPLNKSTFAINDTISFSIAEKKPVDSMLISTSGKRLFKSEGPVKIKLPASPFGMGREELTVQAWFEDGSTDKQSLSLTIVSDIKPEEKSFKVVNIYPHEPSDYTQGLLIHEGFLYESTGLYGKSHMKKRRLHSGSLEVQTELDKKYFGEGLTLLNDELYQLTWKSNKLFVYNTDLEKKRELDLKGISEAWGLADDGEELILSDGSNKLYRLNPLDLSITGTLGVYDDKGAVSPLNELEYVNGLLYANVYQTDKIAVINPESGKVVAYITKINELLRPEDIHREIGVLNGIAYNPENAHFYITGKNWPKLFEIEL